MPLSSASVGVTGKPFIQDVDARRTMAYAAGIGDTLPCYLDTRRNDGVVAHPLFPVCLEWPAVLAMCRDPANLSLAADESLGAVHATHDVILHRLARPGDRLTTRATIVGVERRKPGAYQMLRLDTVDATGTPVCTTWYGGLYLGVAVEGPDCPATDLPPKLGSRKRKGSFRAEVPVSISAVAAHVYTECARIWNPIHTDVAVAEAAGLPATVLHGTATLALAVSRVIDLEANNRPERVRRIAGRFGGMVLMPTEVTVRIFSREATADGHVIPFEVVTAEGQPAVRDGFVLLQL